MTPATTRRLLREAVALLDAAPIRDGYQAWRDMRAALLTDLAAALGVSVTEGILEALTVHRITDAQVADVVRLYTAGELLSTVSRETGVSIRQINVIAHAANLTMRHVGRPKKDRSKKQKSARLDGPADSMPVSPPS